MKNSMTFFSLSTSLFIVMVFSNLSLKSQSRFIDIFDSLKVKIPIIKSDHYIFSFYKSYGKDRWYRNEKNEKKDLIILDNNFYTNYLSINDEFTIYRKDYQTFYLNCIVDFDDEFKHLVLSQYIHNGNESYIYLVSFRNDGIILNVFLLAKTAASPIDFLNISSELVNSKTVKRIKIYMDDSDSKTIKDSVVSWFDKNGNKFIKTKIDSIRIAFN
jgi:hypothetical protein